MPSEGYTSLLSDINSDYVMSAILVIDSTVTGDVTDFRAVVTLAEFQETRYLSSAKLLYHVISYYDLWLKFSKLTPDVTLSESITVKGVSAVVSDLSSAFEKSSVTFGVTVVGPNQPTAVLVHTGMKLYHCPSLFI